MNIPEAGPDDIAAVLRDAQRKLTALRERRGTTPAHTWMCHMAAALTALEQAHEAALGQCLPDVKRALYATGKGPAANPVQALAAKYPEVRRLRVVEVALDAVSWALRDLEEEGKLPVKYLPSRAYDEMPR